MQSSRTSAVGQLCFHGQTEKGIVCLFRESLKDIIFLGCQRCGQAGDYILVVEVAVPLL